MDKYKNILVLSGGGIKGIGHIGCFKALEDMGILQHFDTFAGSSAGALVIGLLVVGYSPDELYQFLLKFNIEKATNVSIENFSKYNGFDTGTKMEYVIKRLISAKGLEPDITLLEIYKKTGKMVVLTTVCWNTAELIYLTHKNYPNMPLYLAIRMSISVPIYYTPVKFNGKIYLDGACMDNYPIKYFEHELDKVVGIYLSDNYKENNNYNFTISSDSEHENLESYITRLIQIFFKANSYHNKKGFEKYTVDVELDYINIVEFSLPYEKKQKIFQAGYDAIIKNRDKFLVL